jgi:hypothetical protein
LNKYNIIWVFVDSVRRYHGNDDRSRLRYMDEFARGAIEFKNVVTSAPSTYMSISAMMTGWHSYFINRNFSDFTFDEENFSSLPKVLCQHGYENFNFWMHPMSRTYMNGILPCVDKSFWPKGFKARKWWSNKMIVELVKNTLEKSKLTKSPKFFFVDLNCRDDAKTGDHARSVFDAFKDHGYDESNSIMILCSDHGYPDPSKKAGDPEFYRRSGLTHDLYLTDDNIMIPFFLKYPGSERGVEIEETIGTIDIMPSILDIIGVDQSEFKAIHGRSFLPQVTKAEDYTKIDPGRFYRCDSRYAMQSGKGTAIRDGNYKYIFYHDDIRGLGDEELFDIVSDPEETTNLVGDRDYEMTLQKYRKYFKLSESEAYEFQIKSLFSRLNLKHKRILKTYNSVLVLDSCNPIFSDLISDICKKINPDILPVLFSVEHKKTEFLKFETIIESKATSWGEAAKSVYGEILSEFPLIIVPYNTSEGRDNKSLALFVEKLPTQKVLWLDYNMETLKSPVKKLDWRYFYTRWQIFRNNPIKGLGLLAKKVRGKTVPKIR